MRVLSYFRGFREFKDRLPHNPNLLSKVVRCGADIKKGNDAKKVRMDST